MSILVGRIDFNLPACSAAPKTFEAGCTIDLSAKAGEAPSRAVRGARTLFARTRLIHVQRAAVEFLAVRGTHRGFGLFGVIHSDERKPARFAGHPVHHEIDFVDGAVLFEQILEIVLGGLESEITYVQFHSVLKLEKLGATEPFPRIGFQTTNERGSPDDLPRSEVKQSESNKRALSPGSGETQTSFHPVR